MKIAVAAIERGDKRAMPQTPSPLVQPEPSLVPKPTSRPPTIKIGHCSTGARQDTDPPDTAINIGVPMSPARKAKRQLASGRVIAPRMPLIPATLPRETQSQAADNPIRIPP